MLSLLCIQTTGLNKRSAVSHLAFVTILTPLRILWQPFHQRQKLIDAIEKHCVLRFVGGYPLHPNLATFSWLNMIKVACIHPQSITLLEAANQLTYTPSSKDQWYVFDPVHLYELQLSTSALSASPNNTSGMNRMISHILANLTATYTNTHVSINTDSSEWVFNNAGGAMGAMW
jgi:hypothetical protein